MKMLEDQKIYLIKTNDIRLHKSFRCKSSTVTLLTNLENLNHSSWPHSSDQTNLNLYSMLSRKYILVSCSHVKCTNVLSITTITFRFVRLVLHTCIVAYDSSRCKRTITSKEICMLIKFLSFSHVSSISCQYNYYIYMNIVQLISFLNLFLCKINYRCINQIYRVN